MARIITKRMTAEIEGDFVIFLIGMRINKFWKIHKWLPIAMAMPKMIKELSQHPESGFLGSELSGPFNGVVVQYWRSFEDLERFARNKDMKHYPNWVKFNKSVASNGDVGIWHETYKIAAGNYESIYNNMPLRGLAKVSALVDATGTKETAAGRIGIS